MSAVIKMVGKKQRGKKYLAIWGNWERGMNSYEADYGLRKLDWFDQEKGYEEDDIKKIRDLQPGELHKVTYGNHYILRLN